MSEFDDLKPTPPAGMPVPDLIEQYRIQRDAWIAQADELARLRDEVRGSAEREAMEIVTAARRDVRHIVMEARRELLVLSAQVQAALGEAGARPDPTALLNRGRDTDDGSTFESSEFSDTVFAPEEAVKGMLDEARADMDALVEDARTVPFQALGQPVVLISPPESQNSMLQEPLEAPPPPLSPAASRFLLSSPFPSDAVPVPSSRRVRTFITLFGVAGLAIVAGTIWWLRSSNGSTPSTAARSTTTAPAPTTSSAAAPSAVSPAASSASAATPTATPTAPAAKATAAASNLSLVVEARRSSWLRATIDGESDSGRTLAAGEKFKIAAQRSVSLRVGDAGAVFVSVNNGEPLPLGSAGQVVTRQFVAENADRKSGATPPLQSVPVSPKPEPLSPPVASRAPTAPVPTPTTTPTPGPLVQPVAAAPTSAAIDPGPPPPAPRVPAPSSTPRAETTPPAPRGELPTPGPSSPASAVIAASRQWLDAYHRQDRATMASLSIDGLQLADERRNEERFPATTDVNRTLDRVSVQIAADTAVLTAVMTERSADNGAPPRVSPISQVWVLNGNQWRVRQVRLVSEARLNQIFR
jgi:RodZ C-terminal domain